MALQKREFKSNQSYKNKEGKTAADIAANPGILEMLGESKHKKESAKQVSQVHVYHTNQLCVNKFMGNMVSKPIGDSTDDDPSLEGLENSIAQTQEANDNVDVNVVREVVDLNKKQKPLNEHQGCEYEEKEENIGPQSFIVHQVLGKGSFGEVYLVEKVSTHKLYAMKVLSKTQIMSQNLVKYALTERDVLSITNHPFIVRLNYAFQTNRKLFLILSYCPGGDLSEYIEREKK